MNTVVITWGFNPNDGKPYLDCYLPITDPTKDASAIKMMDLRGSSQGTSLALIRIPEGCEREDIEKYIEMNTPDAIELLKKAKVRVDDLVRRPHENQAIDFIIG